MDQSLTVASVPIPCRESGADVCEFHLSAMALHGTTSQRVAAAVVRAIDQYAGGAAVGTHFAKGDFLRPHGQISRRAVVCKWGKRASASGVGLVDHPVNWIRVELLIAAC